MACSCCENQVQPKNCPAVKHCFHAEIRFSNIVLSRSSAGQRRDRARGKTAAENALVSDRRIDGEGRRYQQMLTMRMIGVRDYSVFEDGQHIGRIRFASERMPGVWLWHIQVHIPGLPFGSAASLDDAKQSFKTAWLAFKEKHGPESLVAAYREMNKRKEP
jgi:hypothetical protein